MKITYILASSLDAEGGYVQHVLGICRYARMYGIELSLIFMEGKTPLPRDDSFDAVPIKLTSTNNILRIVEFSSKALRYLRTHPTDWVYTRPYPLDYLLLLRHFQGLKIRYAYELNTLWKAELRSQKRHLKAFIYPWFESRSISHAKIIFPVTNEIADYARTRMSKASSVFIAGNGILIPEQPTLSVEQIRRKWHLPLDKKLVVMAGFTRPWHGHEKLVASLTFLSSDYHVVLIGSENQSVTDATHHLSQTLQVRERVHVIAWQPHAHVDEIVYACDVGISPLALESKNMKEAQSLKVRHYLAMGLPVVVAGGESPVVLQSGFCHHLASTKAEEIAKGIVQICSQNFNREKITHMVKEKLSWQSIAKQTFNFLAAQG